MAGPRRTARCPGARSPRHSGPSSPHLPAHRAHLHGRTHSTSFPIRTTLGFWNTSRGPSEASVSQPRRHRRPSPTVPSPFLPLWAARGAWKKAAKPRSSYWIHLLDTERRFYSPSTQPQIQSMLKIQLGNVLLSYSTDLT